MLNSQNGECKTGGREKIRIEIAKTRNKIPLIKPLYPTTIMTETRARANEQIKIISKGKSQCLDEINQLLIARRNKMANNSKKAALEQFKQQAASEVGVTLNQGYNGDLTARQAGSIGGQMVKKMIESYENNMTSGK